MKMHPRSFSTLASMVLLLGVWIAFAPTQLGGQAAYIIVNGNSMEPRFHRGDLVIVRRAAAYHPGDIVTYRHPVIGPVIHRIVAREGDHFVLKGDNNSWLDSYRPTQADFLGKSWLFLPRVGQVLDQVRSPGYGALLGVLMGGIIIVTGSSRKQQRQRRRPVTQELRMHRYHSDRARILAGCTAIACLFGLLAVFAYARPVVRSSTTRVSYQHTGRFDYAASAPGGIYDTGSVRTGEPIFRKLTDKLTVNFAYRLISEQPADMQGTTRLLAVLDDGNGWKRTLALQGAQVFHGSVVSTTGVLDLAQIQRFITRLEQQAALPAQQYKLAVVPEIAVHGTLAGQKLQDEFTPRLMFRLDSLRMQLVQEDTSANPLHPLKQGVIERPDRAQNTLAFFNVMLAVSTVRYWSLIGLGLALVGIFASGFLLLRSSGVDEAAHIQAKYSGLLIAVRAYIMSSDRRLVEVATIEDLVRLAERAGQSILHQVEHTTHSYVVEDIHVTYRYQCTGVASADTRAETMVPEAP
jgi:signal peptidase I